MGRGGNLGVSLRLAAEESPAGSCPTGLAGGKRDGSWEAWLRRESAGAALGHTWVLSPGPDLSVGSKW